ncbi:hypothetical protein ACUN0C_00280 [Faunimonas sp. B44]|uniref:hypothetical protein n=1 Tax=Faunimonas sp. B44 TaxID=3461493 RepID=UPI004043BAA1
MVRTAFRSEVRRIVSEAQACDSQLDIGEALKRLRDVVGEDAFHARRRDLTNQLLAESIRRGVEAQLPII